jgi:hypothetical protein
MIVHDCDQNGPDWYAAKVGVPSASSFANILAKGEGKTRKAYMHRLAAERLTGEFSETYTNVHMDGGHVVEDEIRNAYAFLHDASPVRVGFVTLDDGSAGCSPDSMIGDDGGLEIKSALPNLVVGYIEADRFPSEHKAQVQGALWITGREWWDLAIGPRAGKGAEARIASGVPYFFKRAVRDDAYIANLAAEVSRFNDELAALVELIRRYGEPTPTLREQLERSAA